MYAEKDENLILAKIQEMPVVCRFKFPEGLDREAIESQLACFPSAEMAQVTGFG